jgi:hypothetical protein
MTKNYATCDAKTRAGGKCQRPAGWGTDHPGEGRCKLHGGCVPGGPPGNKKSVRHGIYSQGLHESEREAWENIEVGSIDDEIKVLKIQLRRAVIAQRLHEEYQKRLAQGKDDDEVVRELAEIAEISREYGQGAQGPVDVRKIVRRVRNYREDINRLCGQIAKLEKTNKEIKGEDKDPGETAEEIKRMVREMEDTVPYADG